MKYRICSVNESYLEETLHVVKKTFDEFEAPDYSSEGVKTFHEFINIDNIRKLIDNGFKILVVESYDRIIGMIGYRDNKHISLLFVDKKHHNQGIAKALFEKARKDMSEYSDVITVNSSPYALGFYKKMGFIETNSMQESDGIKYIPMELKLR